MYSDVFFFLEPVLFLFLVLASLDMLSFSSLKIFKIASLKSLSSKVQHLGFLLDMVFIDCCFSNYELYFLVFRMPHNFLLKTEHSEYNNVTILEIKLFSFLRVHCYYLAIPYLSRFSSIIRKP